MLRVGGWLGRFVGDWGCFVGDWEAVCEWAGKKLARGTGGAGIGSGKYLLTGHRALCPVHPYSRSALPNQCRWPTAATSRCD